MQPSECIHCIAGQCSLILTLMYINIQNRYLEEAVLRIFANQTVCQLRFSWTAIPISDGETGVLYINVIIGEHYCIVIVKVR